MEKLEIKNKLIEEINKSKKQYITIEELYHLSKQPILPELIKEINNIILELIEEGILQPLKTTKKNIRGMWMKYKIQKEDKTTSIKEEIATLVKPLQIEYYLKHPDEYVKDKEIILTIQNYIKNKKHSSLLTVNERSYLLWKDEKKLKENEIVLKKLGIDFNTLDAYDTYEPFFYYLNPQFHNKTKNIIIIENKDTFWSAKKAIENDISIYMVIYGEGKKILKSFSYIENFAISKEDSFWYFGDIDYEGINICMSLIHNNPEYKIKVWKDAYKKCVEMENAPATIRHNQNKVERNIKNFCNLFEGGTKEKLISIFEKNKYIPQEILTEKELREIINK